MHGVHDERKIRDQDIGITRDLWTLLQLEYYRVDCPQSWSWLQKWRSRIGSIS